MSTSLPVLDTEAVRRRLPDPTVVTDALRQTFVDLAAHPGAQPPQTVLPLADGESDVIGYRCAIYGDSRSGAPMSASELRPLAERDPELVMADLAELVTWTAPDRPGGPAFFRSVGLGIDDVAIAALLRGAPA